MTVNPAPQTVIKLTGITTRFGQHVVHRDLDLSVTKDWKFGEALTAQFRVEFFNLLNHSIFCNPNGIAGGANSTPGDPNTTGFGSAGSTPDVCASNPQIGSGGPRSIQLGLKLIF